MIFILRKNKFMQTSILNISQGIAIESQWLNK